MTYQGARAAPEESEVSRVFVVSKIKLDAAGHVSDVLWVEVNAKSNLDVSEPVAVPVADVVDAIHDGARVLALFSEAMGHLPEKVFEVVEHTDGGETISLSSTPGSEEPSGPGLQDMDQYES